MVTLYIKEMKTDGITTYNNVPEVDAFNVVGGFASGQDFIKFESKRHSGKYIYHALRCSEIKSIGFYEKESEND